MSPMGSQDAASESWETAQSFQIFPRTYERIVASTLDQEDRGDVQDLRVIPQKTFDLRELELRVEWRSFILFVAMLLMIELFVFRHIKSSPKNHLVVAAFWVCMGLVFNARIMFNFGAHYAVEYFNGYVLEWLLSVDNLVVFSAILTAYRTPQELIHKAIFFGIAGCLVLRLSLFLLADRVLNYGPALRIALGACLLFMGAHSMFSGDENKECRETLASQLSRGILGERCSEHYDLVKQSLFVRTGGRWRATPLAVVVLALEASDAVFAIDSVSAKLIAVPNHYIAYSSTVLAILGLRSCFFVLHDLVQVAARMQQGVAFIMAYMGVQLILSSWLYFPVWSTGAVTLLVLAISLLVSVSDSRSPMANRVK